MNLCVNKELVNRLRYHHKIFTEARYGEKMRQVLKRLNSDGMWHACSDLTSLTF